MPNSDENHQTVQFNQYYLTANLHRPLPVQTPVVAEFLQGRDQYHTHLTRGFDSSSLYNTMISAFNNASSSPQRNDPPIITVPVSSFHELTKKRSEVNSTAAVQSKASSAHDYIGEIRFDFNESANQTFVQKQQQQLQENLNPTEVCRQPVKNDLSPPDLFLQNPHNQPHTHSDTIRSSSVIDTIQSTFSKVANALLPNAAADTTVPTRENKSTQSISMSSKSKSSNSSKKPNQPAQAPHDVDNFSNRLQQIGIPKNEADRIAKNLANNPKAGEIQANLDKFLNSGTATKPGLTTDEAMLIAQGINSSLNALDSLAIKLKCQTAHKVISAVQGLASIGMGIAACMTPGMAIVGIPMIISGACQLGILALGDDDPSPMQAILEQLSAISKQLNELVKFIAEQ